MPRNRKLSVQRELFFARDYNFQAVACRERFGFKATPPWSSMHTYNTLPRQASSESRRGGIEISNRKVRKIIAIVPRKRTYVFAGIAKKRQVASPEYFSPSFIVPISSTLITTLSKRFASFTCRESARGFPRACFLHATTSPMCRAPLSDMTHRNLRGSNFSGNASVEYWQWTERQCATTRERRSEQGERGEVEKTNRIPAIARKLDNAVV